MAYPDDLSNLPANRTDWTGAPADAPATARVTAAAANAVETAINQIEDTLGLTPQGPAASVAARLTALDSTVAGKLATSGTAADAAAVGGVTVTGTPATGQVLKATSPTAATWQADATGGGAVTSVVGATGDVAGSQIVADAAVAAALAAKLGTGAGAVGTANLADGAVTAAKVAADVATQPELDAVAAAKADTVHAHSAADVTSGTLPLTRGGTGGTDAAGARSNLGLGTAATQPATAFAPAAAVTGALGAPSTTTTGTLVAGQMALVDATSAAIARTLPAANSVPAGTVTGVKKIDGSANAVTVSRAGADTITGTAVGQTSRVLTLAGESIELTSDGTSVWVITSTDTPSPSLTGTYAPLSAGAWGNYVLPIGDSITASGSGTAQAQGWFNHLHTRSLGRIRWAGMQAQGGFRVADAAATLVPSTIAQSPRPNGVIIMLGANDCANASGATFELSTWANTYETGVIQPLLNAGIKVALSLITPSDGTGGGVALIKANISAANSWIRARARYAGWPLIDAYSPLVDPADGSMRVIYRNGGTDRIHPNFAGYKAIAEWNVTTLSDWFAPCDQGLSGWIEDPPFNLTKKGLFLVDTDSNGFADGLGPSGGGTNWTGSLVAPSAADRLVGNWQQVVRGTTASAGGWIFDAAPAGSWSVGDVMEFSARIQTSGFAGSGSTFGCYAKNQNDTSTYGIVGWSEDVSDGLVNVRFTIPSTHTGTLYVYMANFGGTVPTQTTTFRVGQVTLRNLTRSTPILLT